MIFFNLQEKLLQPVGACYSGNHEDSEVTISGMVTSNGSGPSPSSGSKRTQTTMKDGALLTNRPSGEWILRNVGSNRKRCLRTSKSDVRTPTRTKGRYARQQTGK